MLEIGKKRALITFNLNPGVEIVARAPNVLKIEVFSLIFFLRSRFQLPDLGLDISCVKKLMRLGYVEMHAAT